jgi:hypothetical protein
VLTDENGLMYQLQESALQYKKNLWIERARTNKTAKLGKMTDMKVIVENGEATIYMDARIFSIWG